MTPIKCVAIDDEPIALSIISEYCRRYGNLDLKCFTSPVEGMECILEEKPDIVFLDIEMNSHNGITLAKELPEETCLILTTAYASYALEGYNVDAVDFLHKPIFYPRFEKAMEKAKRFMRNEEKESSAGTITLKADYKNVVVDLKDIVVIEAMDNYVKIYRKDKPNIVPQIPMKEIEAQLPADRFIRIHRSYIIAIQYVDRFSNRQIHLQHFPRPVPAGRKYLEAYNNLQHLFRPDSNPPQKK